MKSYDFFISYSRQDSPLASRLAHELRRFGMKGFVDQTDIATGASWDFAIKSAIEDTKAIIVILSPHVVSSHLVMAEVGIGQALEKLIIPVLAPGEHIDDSISPLLTDRLVLVADKLSIEEMATQILSTIKQIPLDEARLLLESSLRHREVDTIANKEHLQRLTQGVGVWNAWRTEHPEIYIDLS